MASTAGLGRACLTFQEPWAPPARPQDHPLWITTSSQGGHICQSVCAPLAEGAAAACRSCILLSGTRLAGDCNHLPVTAAQHSACLSLLRHPRCPLASQASSAAWSWCAPWPRALSWCTRTRRAPSWPASSRPSCACCRPRRPPSRRASCSSCAVPSCLRSAGTQAQTLMGLLECLGVRPCVWHTPVHRAAPAAEQPGRALARSGLH